ncbi:2-nitropropane dioxygenase [Armillaria fumosa]|nr:2-nitropropane dioxygenase [Armillaria fumosa]
MAHPILLAGINVAAGPELAAAVSNTGGLGVIGGFGYTPKILRQQIKAIKDDLKDPSLPFGVNLLLPQVGGGARKTNYDYTKGKLDELIDEIVERLHKAKIPIMNMVGHPKHVAKALEVGVDIICAQAGEGGGHTGDTPASILIPALAGAVYDGHSLVANLAWGAQTVWVGTHFVASIEAGAPKIHKELIVKAGYDDVITTLIFTGRPLRILKTPYVADWETNRQAEIKELTSKGVIPANWDIEQHPEKSMAGRPWLMGKVSGLIKDILPAKDIVENMANKAAEILQHNSSLVKSAKAKL